MERVKQKRLSIGIGAIALLVFDFFGLFSSLGAISTLTPDADTFLSSQNPSGNFGSGGALTVSGASATNGAGQQNGLYDSVIRFSSAEAVTAFDAMFGSNAWLVTRARLTVTEMAAPDNATFNRGVGGFEILWSSNDLWLEGTGTPKTPTTDGIAWQDLPALAGANLDTSLGMFTNSGLDGPETFFLQLRPAFVADMRQGGEVSLLLSAVSADIGFTFNSRNVGNTNARPMLEISAEPDPLPRIGSITCSGTNVTLAFTVVSNWTCTVEFSGALPCLNWV
ncbi:MAG TPA: hypothetical protein VLT36_08010, partial [Candidatus Dormibacteraeota bacterium]|nr:hypothetical protein [Candidatus Dormibacteraeota bacterium]